MLNKRFTLHILRKRMPKRFLSDMFVQNVITHKVFTDVEITVLNNKNLFRTLFKFAYNYNIKYINSIRNLT